MHSIIEKHVAEPVFLQGRVHRVRKANLDNGVGLTFPLPTIEIKNNKSARGYL